MNTISITTSQNIELEYDLGSLGDRVLGYIIDWVIIVAYGVTIIATIGFGNFGDFFQGNAWLVILLALPVFFYDLLSETILNGQSLGKKAMGIKVISLNGEQPALSQYLMRWLFRLIDFSFSNGLLAFIMVAATEKKQRLGDLVAGTVLVKTKPRTHFTDTIYHPTHNDEYNVTYPEVSNLKDRDVQLVKEVILSVYKSRNTMLASQAQERIEEVLNIKSRHYEPVDFLRTVLADYNHLTSNL